MTQESITERRPLSEQVADALTKRILDQNLVPGDRLPTEPELVDEFGVSRTVIREAGRTLVARGIVDIRPRRGMSVASFNERNLSRQLALTLRLGGGTFAELMELRKAMEPDAAAYAALRRNDDDVKELRRLVDLLDDGPPAGRGGSLPLEDQIHADLDFHAAIAKATKNPFFVHMALPLNEILSANYLSSPGYSPEREKTHIEHARIAEAIAHGDPTSARDLAVQHIERVTAVEELLTPSPRSRGEL